MLDADLTPPQPVPQPRSRLRAAAGRLYYLARAAVLLVRTEADKADLADRLQQCQAELLATQTALAVARAERDSAQKEVETLSLVLLRDRERVQAESAGYTAARERAINSAAADRGARVSDD